MGLEAQKKGKFGAKDQAILEKLKKRAPSIKVYGETIDLSKGAAGLFEPLTKIATNPAVLVDVMQTAEKTRKGIEDAQKLFKDGGGLKAIDNVFKNLF